MLTVDAEEVASLLRNRLGPDYTVSVTEAEGDDMLSITAENVARGSGPLVIERQVHFGTVIRAVAFIAREIQAQTPA